MLLIDSHVHIYNRFNLDLFFSSAFSNFAKAAESLGIGTYVPAMVIVDWSDSGWFANLGRLAGRPERLIGPGTPFSFRIEKTLEDKALAVKCRAFPTLFLLAGKKIITAENLEVLALCSLADFKDGKPLVDIVHSIDQAGAIPVIPWAVGKWLGKRGRVIDDLLNAADGNFYLSDNGNRPGFWKLPRHFREAKAQGIRIISGSDPLRFDSEVDRAGCAGFIMNGRLDPDFPASTLCQHLRDRSTTVFRFGVTETTLRFFRNQALMQLRKNRINNQAVPASFF